MEKISMKKATGTELAVFNEIVDQFPALAVEHAAKTDIGPAIDAVLAAEDNEAVKKIKDIMDSDESNYGKIYQTTDYLKQLYGSSGNPMLAGLLDGELIKRTRVRVNRIMRKSQAPFRWEGLQFKLLRG